MMSSEPRYRYPGLEPFSSAQREVFFGREADLDRLWDLVHAHQQVLLYAKSGLGKSSLINAGLISRLQQRTDALILPVRIGTWVNAQSLSPVEAVRDALPTCGETALDRIIPQEGSLWYRFKSLSLQETQPRTCYLILDQFEELFSHPEAAVYAFKKQMADLLYRVVPQQFRAVLEIRQQEQRDILTQQELTALYQPMNIRVLYAIREDRYSDLNRLADYLPDLLHHRFQLAPLSREQAEEAIVRPAAIEQGFSTPAFSYTPQALTRILNYLSAGQQQAVETTQLQILCTHFERLGRLLIREEDIPEFDNIFLQFYEESIACLDPVVQPLAREFIEEEMILEGQRIAYHELVCLERLPADALEILLRERHLLRTERSCTGISYELSHDTLVAPILLARKKRLEEMAEAERHAREARAERERVEQEMIAVEEKKRIQDELKKAEAEKDRQLRQLRRTRLFLATSVIMSLVAMWAFLYARKAQKGLGEAVKKAEIAQEAAAANEQKALESLRALYEGQLQQLQDKKNAVQFLDDNMAHHLQDSINTIQGKVDSLSGAMQERSIEARKTKLEIRTATLQEENPAMIPQVQDSIRVLDDSLKYIQMNKR